MRLTRLVGADFRNLEPFDLETDATFVVLHGRNAQGKTNALEAVWWLATLKPLRGPRRSELIRWGGDTAVVSGWVDGEGLTQKYRVDLDESGRTVQLDGRRVTDLQEYFAGVRAIAFTPQDGRIVSEEPARRRQWLDRAAFTARPAHLGIVRTYSRCLQQKSAALRAARPDAAVLDALDMRLAQAGAHLAQRRAEMLAELGPHVSALHGAIAGGHAKVVLRYRTVAAGDTIAERTQALLARFSEVRHDELRRRITLAGPQKDDVNVVLDDHSARAFGSQGQVRSLVLSLKLAELVAARERGDVPLFLLDDVSSELDRGRTGRLVATLRDLGAQVFATTTDPDHLSSLPRGDTLQVRVEGGSLTRS